MPYDQALIPMSDITLIYESHGTLSLDFVHHAWGRAELVGVKIYVASKIYIAICHTSDSIFTDDSFLRLGDILSFL